MMIDLSARRSFTKLKCVKTIQKRDFVLMERNVNLPTDWTNFLLQTKKQRKSRLNAEIFGKKVFALMD